MSPGAHSPVTLPLNALPGVFCLVSPGAHSPVTLPINALPGVFCLVSPGAHSPVTLPLNALPGVFCLVSPGAHPSVTLPLNALPGVFLPGGSGCSPLCDFASYCTTCSNGYFLSMFRSRCPGAQQSPWPVALVRRIHPIWFSPHSITLRVGR